MRLPLYPTNSHVVYYSHLSKIGLNHNMYDSTLNPQQHNDKEKIVRPMHIFQQSYMTHQNPNFLGT